MRIAVYNSMFSLNGKSFLGNVLGHWAVHCQVNASKLLKRTDINRTMEIIKKSKADVIGICEILEEQEKEVKEKLRKLGYKYIFFSDGHNIKCGKLGIRIAIASKLECKAEKSDGFPVIDKFAGGGGFVNCYFPKLKMNVFCAHFSIPRDKALYQKQMAFLQKYVKKTTGKLVLMGDFNKSHKKLKPYFLGLELASGCHKSCSATPILKTVHFKDDDHIFVRDIKFSKSGCMVGHSDHKLIYADLI